MRTNNNPQGPFRFLRLPPEIRNKIYYDALITRTQAHWYSSAVQPALTRVNRQLRAEALPIYYRENIINFDIQADTPQKWVDTAREIIDAFGGSSSGFPDSSNFRYITHLHLEFHTDVRYLLGAKLISADSPPEENVDEDWRDLPAYPTHDVRVGRPGMDWRDGTAVRVACSVAAEILYGEVRHDVMDLLNEESDLTRLIQRSALAGICVFTAACPHLTESVFIADFLRGATILSGFERGCWQPSTDSSRRIADAYRSDHLTLSVT